MTLTSLFVHDVTIRTPAMVEDRYGDAVKDWDNATDTDVKGWVSQNTGSEVAGHREAHVSDWTLFLHPDATITGQDRVIWEGITFEVDGPTNPAWSPRGVHHLEVPLRAVVG